MNLKLKTFKDVEKEIFRDEYELCKKEYDHLEIKKFYVVEGGYVAIENINVAKASVMSAYEKLISMGLDTDELEEEIEYLNSNEAVDILVEEFDIFKFPSFILE